MLPANSVDLAFACVLTAADLDQFRALRRSVELSEGNPVAWFIQGDKTVARALAKTPGVTVALIDGATQDGPVFARDSRHFARQVIRAIKTAWRSSSQKVVFCAADSVVLQPFWRRETITDLLVIGNKQTGLLNPFAAAALVLTTRNFDQWWDASLAVPQSDTLLTPEAAKFNQDCSFELVRDLLECNPRQMLEKQTSLVHLDTEKNVLFRVPLFDQKTSLAELAKRTFILESGLIYRKAGYRPFFSAEQMLHKAFSIHCLRALRRSPNSAHHALLTEILASDALGLYQAYTDVPSGAAA